MRDQRKPRMSEDGRRSKRRGAYITKWGRRLVEATDMTSESAVPTTDVLTKFFDATNDDEIAAISAEIGATGARRPASE